MQSKYSLRQMVKFLITWNNTSVCAHLRVKVTCMSPSPLPGGYHSGTLPFFWIKSIGLGTKYQCRSECSPLSCITLRNSEMSVKKWAETIFRTSPSIPFLLGSPKLCAQTAKVRMLLLSCSSLWIISRAKKEYLRISLKLRGPAPKS